MTPFSLQNKKIFIAGHNGMVGSAVCRRLKSEDVEILTADRTVLDLTRQAETERWFAAHKPDCVILAAAHVGGILANRDEPADFLQQNLQIQNNVIEAAYQCGVEKLLFLGSSCIYPKETAQPIKEEALLTGVLEKTNEPYAIAKIAGLKLCESYNRQYGTNFITGMPCNLYGIGDRYDEQRSHVLPALIMKMHQAKMDCAHIVTVWGTGKPLREFMDVDDLADGLIFLMQHYNENAPINIGTGQDISIHDLALLIAEIVGFDGQIEFDTEKPDGTMRKCLDTSCLDALGWKSSIQLRVGIEKAYDWYCKNHVRSNGTAERNAA